MPFLLVVLNRLFDECHSPILIDFFLTCLIPVGFIESPTYPVVDNSSPPLTIKSDSTPSNNSRRTKDPSVEGNRLRYIRIFILFYDT